jgi:antitoxin MazE
MIAEMRTRSQITLPASIVKQLDLKEGDKIELVVEDGKIIITPVITVPKDQAWFWTEKWQKEEKEVDEQLKTGQLKGFENIDDLIEDLNL